MEKDNRIWLQKLFESNVGYSFNKLPLEDEAFVRAKWNKYFATNTYGFVGERSIYVKDNVNKDECLKCLSDIIKCLKRANIANEILNDWIFEERYLSYTEFVSENHFISPKTSDDMEKNQSESFSSIFTNKDWDKYLKSLTRCTPQLLTYDVERKMYRFVGNKKTERGCIGQYFKQLKAKGKIKNHVNRNELAKVLSNSLIDFSISGSSIDNESSRYKDTYENQLVFD